MVHDMTVPAVVFPTHSPDGLTLGHLETIAPHLRQAFSQAFVSISAPTWELRRERVAALAADPFFDLVRNPAGLQVGDHFLNGFARAAERCEPGQQLHLCTVDRLAYALETEHRDAFLQDVKAARDETRPLLFQRSPRAWSTHPRSYQAVEAMATRAGEVLFGRSLDFAWCHLALRAGDLKAILPGLEGLHDLTFFAEVVLLLRERLVTRDVDWLAWEDPFILGRDGRELRREREDDPTEWEKRLGYVALMVRRILAHAAGRPD